MFRKHASCNRASLREYNVPSIFRSSSPCRRTAAPSCLCARRAGTGAARRGRRGCGRPCCPGSADGARGSPPRTGTSARRGARAAAAGRVRTRPPAPHATEGSTRLLTYCTFASADLRSPAPKLQSLTMTMV